MNNPILFPYYENKYWWKFANVLSWLNERSILLEKDFVNWDKVSLLNTTDSFYDFLTTLYPELCTTTMVDDAEVECVKQPIYDIVMLLQKRYFNHYIFETHREDSDEAIEKSWEWLKKLFNTIEYTYKKYSKIIELYTDNYNTLMKQLENTTESGSRFNDTPQQKEVNLSFESNEYTTSLTKLKSVSRSDSDTPINKIEEIIRNYRNILLIWLDEFDGLFVKEGNV